MKYKEWLLVWLEKYIKPSSKIRTYDRYCQLTYGVTKVELVRQGYLAVKQQIEGSYKEK